MMKIMRASAGSGKTFNLAKTYITILLKSKDRYAYRHILAVTFTNKATAEMKSRILKELHTLAQDPRSSGYYSDFVPVLAESAESLQKTARRVLVDILHDYSAFSISTIDRFFQQALKAFSRELGHFSSYQVELDKKSLVHESVDRILDSLKEDDKDMIAWLNEGVMDQLGRGDRVNLENGLYDMAEKLKSDEFRELTADLTDPGAELFSAERLASISSRCEEIEKAFTDRVVDAAREVCAVFESVSVPIGETNRHFMECVQTRYSVLKYGDKIEAPSDSFLAKAADSEKWFAKTKNKLLERVDGLLNDPLDRFCALFAEPYRIYLTALLLKEKTFSLGIAGELDRSFTELTKEKNVLGIDDSNFILKDIIDGSDTPFIYEKLGVRYEHFLLDEFQDTSSIQWQNFLPLLRESNSHEDSTNLVVGDVKQSIYRWRGSDWKLLAQTLPSSFFGVELETLGSNYRSAYHVVSFNNALFTYAAERLGLSDIYSDVVQEVKSRDEQKGSVRLTFCPEESELDYMLDSIREAVDSGARYGDIAVLVRKNDSGAQAASYLIEHGIPVISDDSLAVKSSVTVRRLVSLLSFVENPADTVSSYLAQSLNIGVPDKYRSLVDLCEHFLRALHECEPGCFEAEVLYIQSFMDTLQDWCALNGQNLLQFLKFWADADPKLSSPADLDSVRIITVHKSKGLEYPHVIMPFAEKVTLHGSAWHWCKLDSEDPDTRSALDPAMGGVYPVQFVKEVGSTLFGADYEQERMNQTVDNLNVLYVALTRAEKTLHVIAEAPSRSVRDVASASDFSQVLYAFAAECGSECGLRKMECVSEDGEMNALEYVLGESYSYERMTRKTSQDQLSFDASYASVPLSGRLTLSEDASDFFAQDGSTGLGASPRVRGVILHDILSRVVHPSDLGMAVQTAVTDGRLSAAEGESVRDLLSERIASAVKRGWFPESGDVSNEITLIGADGEIQRPDRVVTTPQGTIIIDYKFGSDRPDKYARQVRRYVRLYKSMGYSNVSGFIWYVQDDETVMV